VGPKHDKKNRIRTIGLKEKNENKKRRAFKMCGFRDAFQTGSGFDTEWGLEKEKPGTK